MTRQQWIERCAKRYQVVGALAVYSSLQSAEACADIENQEKHPDDWTLPEEAADADIAAWDDY